MSWPTITLAILAKQKARVLPLYLHCIDALDYPKDRISLFVRTNDNTDHTESILRSWLDGHGHAYAAVHWNAASIDPGLTALGAHEWTRRRFITLNQVREHALRAALAWGTDFYFVADCDNWILPHTLRSLVAADRPIVAPFLRHTDPTRLYSNYHYRVTADGWFQDCEEQRAVWRRERCGLIEVACVHCTYLVRSDVIPRLAYEDGSDRYDYVVFSESARRAGIPQYLDNREVYGWLNTGEDPTVAARLIAAATSTHAIPEPRVGAEPPGPVVGGRRRPAASTRGASLATVLEGAWRSEAAELAMSVSELVEITPSLLTSGEGALAWWRLRGSRLADSAPAHALRQALRRQAIEGLLHEGRLGAAFARLRHARIQPILGKGWAVARLYPDPALRPHGDIDLFVPHGIHGSAASALEGLPVGQADIDLHRGFAELDDFPTADLNARSHLQAMGTDEVRVFGEEDHLRLLCLHMLRHGACRPLWLCDVAVALERRSRRFDWDVFLGGDSRRADRAVCALVLSHELLGARLDDVPLAVRRRTLPRWLVPTVLRQWGAIGFVPHGRRTPFGASLRAPRALPGALRARWPNGIEATVGVDGSFNELPRLPLQIAESTRRALRFVGRPLRLTAGRSSKGARPFSTA
jgi:hypothetical protein